MTILSFSDKGVRFLSGKNIKITLKSKIMYKKYPTPKTTISVNTSYEGETIEKKINRIVNNKEPITDGAPLIYTDRKNGVQAEYDIRTDRFEIAVEAMDKVKKTYQAQRENRINAIKDLEKQNKEIKNKTAETKETGNKSKDGGPESIQGTK